METHRSVYDRSGVYLYWAGEDGVNMIICTVLQPRLACRIDQ